MRITTWSGRLTAVAAALALAVGTGACSAAAGTDDPVSWIDSTAAPLSTGDLRQPVDDLEPLRNVAGDAVVVGLGESAHGLGEQFVLRQRMARYLVEQKGFRTLSFENDFGNGVDIDRYVVDGVGDPHAIVGSAVAAWRSQEMLDLVRWVREFNLAHPQDKVRILGTDVTQLRRSSVDEVTRYVAKVAPQRLAELRGHLDPITPRSGPGAQIMWFFQQPDKDRIIAHAMAALAILTGLPAGTAGADRELAIQHARAIAGFYQSYADPESDLRDRIMADTIDWWRARTGGHKVVYFAANVHVAASPRVDYSFPPTVTDATLVPTGHHLRGRYGAGYVPIASVFGSGHVLQGWETGSPSVYAVPPAQAGFVDHTLGRAAPASYLLDLRGPASDAVRRWRDAPATMRIIGAAYDPAMDRGYSMRIGSLSGGFDAVAHLGTSTAADLLR